MAKVKVGLWGLSVPLQIQKSRNVVSHMTGNASFMNPNPLLGDVTNAINATETSYEAGLSGDRVKKALTRVNRKFLIGMMNGLGAYVQNVSVGNEQVILSSGFETAKVRGAVETPETPQSLKVKNGELSGQLVPSWKKSRRSTIYLVEMMEVNDGNIITPGMPTPGPSPFPVGGWMQVGNPTQAHLLVSNLTPGRLYRFRVQAIGAGGSSGWSDVTEHRAL